MKIKELGLQIKSRTILTSRGQPTVEVDIIYDGNVFRSSCPSGASTGSKEAKVLLDHGKKYNGKDVENVHGLINYLLIPKILASDVDPTDQKQVDDLLRSIDGTENKEKVGANSILPLSLSFCKLGAFLKKKSLVDHISNLYEFTSNIPVPHFNILNGGLHSGNGLAIQEIMVVFNHKSLKENIESISVFYETLKLTISEKYGCIHTSVGDEGGFAPPIKTIEEGIDLLLYTGGQCTKTDFKIAIDVAANSFYKYDKYYLYDKIFTNKELGDYYRMLIRKYPQIYSLEDPFAEDDIDGWRQFFKNKSKDLNVVGDDLTVTNSKLVENAGKEDLCNVLLVKPNQIGTISEAVDAIKTARKFKMKIMVSHRSGETEDTFISDFAVAVGAEFFKSGGPSRGERVSKYNQLIRLDEEKK